MIDPEMQLSHSDRSHLHVLVTSEGWRILQRIMEVQVEKFKVDLINVKAGDTAALIEQHAITKSAAQFVVGLVNRLNDELALYHSEMSSKKPVDITENLIDLGETAAGEDEVI